MEENELCEDNVNIAELESEKCSAAEAKLVEDKALKAREIKKKNLKAICGS